MVLFMGFKTSLLHRLRPAPAYVRSAFTSNSRLCLCVQTQGRFIPSCDEDGYYRKQQCDRGECWCVDQNGGEVAGSRIRGKPDCGESGSGRVLLLFFCIRIRPEVKSCTAKRERAAQGSLYAGGGPLRHNSAQGPVAHSCVPSHLHSKGARLSQ